MVWRTLVHDEMLPPLLWFLRLLLLIGVFLIVIELFIGTLHWVIGLVSLVISLALVYGITHKKKWSLYGGLALFVAGFIFSMMDAQYATAVLYALLSFLLYKERKYF